MIEGKISRMLRDVSQGQRSRGAFMQAGPGAVRLQSGDPSFDTPLHIREAAFKAMNEGHTHYCSGLGDKSLREGICASLHRDYGVEMGADEILITNGAAGAIFLTAAAFLERGDEAVVFDPSYSLYAVGIRAAGAKVVRAPLSPDFHYDEEEFLRRITPQTRMVFLNNPNNPTATCFSREDLESIAAVCERHDLLLAADEVYHKLVFDGRKHICAGSLRELSSRVILINSFSKTYAMTGWRIGYIAAPAGIIKALVPLNRAFTGSVNTISQKAALAALLGPQDCVRSMFEEYAGRRELIHSLVNGIEGLRCPLPEGAFYVFCGYDREIKSEDMAHYLAERGVTVRSGTEFGAMGEKHIRLTFAASREAIESGMEKIAAALKH